MSTLKKGTYVKSPLNYTGGKHKLLNQILPLFPTNIDTFVDIFAGGFNVGVNINADKIIANDKCQPIINLFKYFKTHNKNSIIKTIDKIIKHYNLTDTAKFGYEYYNSNSSTGVANYNKENYLRLRDDYNAKKTPIHFFILIVYAFNNQIRFNNKGDFNLPVNKRDFTSNMRENLLLFIDEVQNKEIKFTSKDYGNVLIPNSSFVYLDPPYLISQASYNENGAWNEHAESKLLDYIDNLDKLKIQFALSNVLTNKGKSNERLIKWSKNYNIHYLEKSYHNSNYQIKDRCQKSTTEVLITNY